jgi:GalNAc5-diNAcBac-PP-undecaprenol beta-1,3-glucosyltransferase
MPRVPEATIICPTFDHGPTLTHSLACALAQTVEDIELFVVGDGVPDVTREIVGELAARDSRVRFFDNPKGERNGELHRHGAIAEGRSERILYLTDDDLWLPEHVETMLAALEHADFAHTLPVWVLPDGEMGLNIVDTADGFYRERLLQGDFSCGLGLSRCGHTLELYRRLPRGWQPAPTGVPSDHYMWQQILGEPWVRPFSAPAFTALGLPSPARRGWSVDQRAEELGRWAARLADPVERRAIEREVLATFARRAAWERKHATLERQELERKMQRGSLAALLRRSRRSI